MSDKSIRLMLRHDDGTLCEAIATLDLGPNPDRYGLLMPRIKLSRPGGEESGGGQDYFDALCAVRQRLASFGLVPLCYGACRNFVVSGMARDMAQGLRGYLVNEGQHATSHNVVSLFDAGPEMDIATVEEQSAFKEKWLATPRK